MRGAIPAFALARDFALRLAALVVATAALTVVGLVLLGLFFPGVAHAQEVPETTEAALALAESRPHSAAAQLDAGVLLARDERIGEAVLHLERALLLAPLDRSIQDARALVVREARARRMEAANSRTVTEGEPGPVSWWRFFALLHTSTYAVVLAAGNWLLFGLLFARWRRRPGGVRDAFTVGAVLAALLLTLAGAMWIGRAVTEARLVPAVVVNASPIYRESPDELARRRAHPDLYEGGVVLIREARDDWRQVELVGGERVWVTADVVAPLEPDDQPAP